MDRYHCWYKDDLGYKHDASYTLDKEGDWYDADEMDNKIKKLNSEIQTLKIIEESYKVEVRVLKEMLNAK